MNGDAPQQRPRRQSALTDALSRAAGAVARSGVVLKLALLYLCIAAAGRLAYALPRLVYDLEEWSALDLRYRYNEVQQWFAGNPVYGVVDGAVYPPAAHVILWPFLGWLSFEAARWLWAATTLLGAAALAIVVLRIGRPAPFAERLALAGLAVAGYPLQLSIFVGQMGVHVAAFLAIAAALLFDRRPGLGRDALAALALACSLVKPTLSLPLVVAALIAARRARPALLLAAAYAGLSVFAVALQPAGPFQLVRDWLAVAGYRVPVLEGVPNLHLLFARLELRALMTPVSLLTLATMSAWAWWQRRGDAWLILGAAAIVARFWAHSTLYDDAFLLLPLAALLRVRCTHPQPALRSAATALLVAGWLALLTPTWVFYDLGAAIRGAIHAGQAVLWLAVLALLAVALRQRDAAPDQRLTFHSAGK